MLKAFQITLFKKYLITRLFIGVAVVFGSLPSFAEGSYKIAIIIDDLGNSLSKGKQLINMPYQMTYAILPNRPYSEKLANMAKNSGKEVMVHLPMQSSQPQDLGD
ncbi:MAG: divergent polysaccharide deacetylase family protein, partial [Pseudomonadota bacterium]